MLWSSNCKPLVWRMINQTDWMGQIWFVIAQKGRGSKREMDYSVSFEDMCVCVCRWVNVCTCVCTCLCTKVQRCARRGLERGCCVFEGQRSNKWNMKE